MIVARPRHPAPTSAGPFNPAALRDEFPTLHRAVAGGELTYLDSAASSLTPRVVIEALERFYRDDYANIHRAGHQLAAAATAAYEGARARVQRFINAASAEEVVFVRSCTEALNLVATSYGGMELGRGDEVLVSEMEHHSNFLPWQRLCHDRGADFVVAPIDDRGELQLDRLQRAISPRTKIVAVAHVSNALGTINPLRRVIELAHAKGAKVVVDGAQGAVHLPVDVRQKMLQGNFQRILDRARITSRKGR